MLFKFDKKSLLLLEDDAYKLVPDLRDLSIPALTFLVLYCDYDSPFHQFPEEERLLKAKRQVYGDDGGDVEKLENMVRAIESYRGLQYDSRRETIIKYQKKIGVLGDQLLHTTDFKDIKVIDDAIDRLMDRCVKIQKDIDSDESISNIQLKGGGKLSFLEKWQSNMVAFKASEKQRMERIGIEYF